VSTESISIEISGVQHGWASAELRSGERAYRLGGFSYVTYAFDDLLRLGVDIALGAYEAEIVFDGEPAGWAWTFQQAFENGGWPCKLRIYELDDASNRGTRRTEAFVAEVDRDQIALAILDSVKRLEDALGVQGFEKHWGQSFPVRGIAALEAALSTARRPDPDRGEPVMVVKIVDGDANA
jgi:hypothetical protein